MIHLLSGEANITEKDVEDMVEALQKAKAQLVTKVTVSKEVLKIILNQMN